MTVQGLLDPASALVERIAGQPDDVERIQHGGGVGEFFGGGGLEVNIRFSERHEYCG